MPSPCDQVKAVDRRSRRAWGSRSSGLSTRAPPKTFDLTGVGGAASRAHESRTACHPSTWDALRTAASADGHSGRWSPCSGPGSGTGSHSSNPPVTPVARPQLQQDPPTTGPPSMAWSSHSQLVALIPSLDARHWTPLLVQLQLQLQLSQLPSSSSSPSPSPSPSPAFILTFRGSNWSVLATPLELCFSSPPSPKRTLRGGRNSRGVLHSPTLTLASTGERRQSANDDRESRHDNDSDHGSGYHDRMDTEDASPAPTPAATSQQHNSPDSIPQPAHAGNSGAQSHGNPTPASSTTNNSAGSGNQPASATQNQTSLKRRRGLGIVTPNACTECRKKRAKCDGHKPCARCKSQRNVECVYEAPVRQSKENLRNEIESLRARQRSSDQVLSSLSRPDLWEEVLARLRNGQSIETISEWLGRAPPPGSASAMTPSFSRQGDTPGPMAGAPGPTLAPISSFIGSGGGGIGQGVPHLAPLNLGGLGTGLSPILSHPNNPVRNDLSNNSPWSFSSHSQPGSARSGSHPDAMNWTATAGHADISSAQPNRVHSWAPDSIKPAHMSEHMPRFAGLEHVLSPLSTHDMHSPSGSWTNITNDINLVLHLLGLYFCWEYPTFASLSKEHFLRDFQDGRQRYCSPILVNALLALGCRFSTKPMTRADPDDPYTSGDHFFKESQRLFYLEHDHHSLTTIQALGIMSIREASCGRDSESWYYAGQSVRLAIEMGLHRLHDRGDEDEVAVQAATFWGAFALDHAWSLATGSLPQCSCFPHLPPKPAIIQDIEASVWVPYTDDGAPLQRSCTQPSNVRSVYKCFCELSELVHESLYILHSPGNPLTARDLLNIYTQYLNWYDRIPEVLRLGHNFTPAVLFAHMYYHFAILLLFRPLIKLRILGSKVLPRDVCAQAADAIQGLLKSYSQLYTLRRTPSFVPYFVLTSSIMHLAIAAPDAVAYGSSPQSNDTGNNAGSTPSGATSTGSTPKNLQQQGEQAVKTDPKVQESMAQGIKVLEEMAPCHHFAEQALNILRYLAKKWNVDVGSSGAYSSSKNHNHDQQQQRNTGHRADEDYDRLVRPYTNSLNFFAPNVPQQEIDCVWGSSGEATSSPAATGNADGSGSNRQSDRDRGTMGGGGGGGEESPIKRVVGKAAESMENPLFWPFPMQGRPILPGGQDLEKAGFALL